MTLDVEIGVHSERGARPLNEDYAAVALSRPDSARGLIGAIADGVAQGGRGTEAAQTTVSNLLTDFYAVPDTWETTVAIDRVLGAQNAWLAAQNRRRRGAREPDAALTTLTAIVLQGHGYTVAHVGDTRAWQLRDGVLTLLTDDHNIDHPDLRAQLTRAVGLDDALRVDYLQGELQVGDSYLLTSDGVHGVLAPQRLAELVRQGAAQEACIGIVRAALAAGSRDNASAVLLRVHRLAPGGLEDALRRSRQLPVPGRLQPGERLDGFEVLECLADNGVHRVYLVRDVADQTRLVIKTLHASRAADAQECAMLAHEAWLAARVTERDARGFARLRTVADPTFFYLAYEWHEGLTMAQLQAEERAGKRSRCGVAEVVDAGIALARALGRLHRLHLVHRDINPRNLHRGLDGQWRILDLGVALSGLEPPELRALHAGTPSYMNPEQWEPGDAGADARSDLFALGVTLYEWLTGALPYGEIEPWQRAAYRNDPRAPSRRRPDVPIWLDHVLLKALARERTARFETAEEFVLALERGAARPLRAPRATPLLARDPAAWWKIAFAIALACNVLLVIWLLFLPR
jgi:serine/threonine protein phosphatase PrpC